ncbi:DUF3054 domain-containing protein [Kocuria coralli]|uniref:DUF3054 domain-containing protein n=1 Tax=Kocuria coralli TaxID=1461025 RepID=A0A5J5KVU9_9MICC|nr:DUF3054 domain-containing protein [Kocuria coralli]KAA9393370.1 DUF3054 domain-containing protein [Kocuria coralli]
MIPDPLPQPADEELPVKNVRGAVVAWIAIDLVLVCVFAALGRTFHGEDPWGFLDTAWPFLAAASVGWVGIALARRPGISPLGGLILWAVTVVGGLTMRSVSGGGVQWSFAVVTALVLLVFLLGWRLIAWVILRGRSRPAGPGADPRS